jgi:hypothetical protein
MTLLKPVTNTSLLTPYELFFIQSLDHTKKLIPEQRTGKPNPLFQLAFKPPAHSQHTTKHTPTIEKWCTEHRLEISKEKSALMPVLARNRDEYKRHPTTVAWGINVVSKMRYLGVILDYKLECFPHSQHLELKLLRIRNRLVRCSIATWGMSFHNLLTIYKHAILSAITYASEAWRTTATKRARRKLLHIQRSYLLFITKAYRTVSNEAQPAIAGIMPLDLAMLLHSDIRAISRRQPTNTVLPELNKV